METFSFSPPLNPAEEGKWLLTVTSFEATISDFNKTDENISFSITIPGYWTSRGAAETKNGLRDILGLREQNVFVLHVKGARKKRKANKNRRH